MTPAEMNVAIAEAVGYRFVTKNKGSARYAEIVVIEKDGKELGSFWPDDTAEEKAAHMKHAGILNYVGSLDCMHEAEKVLTDAGKWVLYTENLGWVGAAPDRRILHAEAHHRAEAFLRTIGKFNPPRDE